MGNSKVDLSIIVPCFNVEKYVARCIDSLINQTLDNTRYEIILVDDASTDCTWKIITEYEKNIRI
ncbi:MAG: glycosyltransferase [Lachnospira sp.]|jgi:glycosyltransferase involved in cell wall biosynthesis|nr:glycosyltransferase [Lachnospira sp.]